MTNSSASDADIFRVSQSMDFFGRLVLDNPRTWRLISKFETKVLAARLADIEIERPVFITGLARSGGRILLEIMAELPGVASHRNKDFPLLFTPYWSNWLFKSARTKAGKSALRTHRDGATKAPNSPEAMEEALWMQFFSGLHEPRESNVLNATTSNSSFEKFYIDHIRKLLLGRNADRYVAKANYHVTRLEYLLKIFPDARFVIPVRQPVAHIASLMKQQDLFRRGQKANPRARAHLKRVGEFEFGLDRRPINTGNTERTKVVYSAWRRGEEIRGWAIYWSQVYGYLADLLEKSPAVRAASILIRFEDLCDQPKTHITNLFAHCGFPDKDHDINAAAGQIRKPTNYANSLADDEIALIKLETYDTAKRLRY